MCLENYCQSMPLFQDKCNPEWQYTYYYKFLSMVLHYFKMSIYRVTLQIYLAIFPSKYSTLTIQKNCNLNIFVGIKETQ